METRKIQLAGGTTYTVSLPKEWASEHGIEPGAPVHVYPHDDGSLVVRTNGHPDADPEPLTVSAHDRTPDGLRRAVRAGYETGHDAVAVTDVEPDARERVRSAGRALLGVDVVVEHEERLVCESLLDTSDVSVEQTLRQLQFVACETVRDALAALRGEQDPDHAAERADEATRLRAMVSRQFERALVNPDELDGHRVGRSTLADYDAAAGHLRRAVADATTIATVADRRDEPDPDVVADLVTVGEDVCALLDEATQALLGNAGPQRACTLLADRDDLVAATRDRALDADAGSWVGLVAGSLTDAADRGGVVAEHALRRAVRPDYR